MSSNCWCRCCDERRRAAGAGRLLPRRDDGDRRRQLVAGASASRRSPRRGISPLIPEESRAALQDMWRHARGRRAKRSARCRWKCSRPPSGRSIPSAPCASSPTSAALDPASAEARRFVELEDWANEGEPLPYPAARRADRGFVRRATARAAARWTRRRPRGQRRARRAAAQPHRRARPHRARRDRARRRRPSRSRRAMSG